MGNVENYPPASKDDAEETDVANARHDRFSTPHSTLVATNVVRSEVSDSLYQIGSMIENEKTHLRD